MCWMLVLLFSVSFPAIAQVYKWTDENGNVHFGSQPPPGQQQEEVKIQQSAPGAMGSNQDNPLKKSTHNAVPPEKDPLLESRKEGRAALNDLQCRSARKKLADAKRIVALKESLTGNANSSAELRMEHYEVDLYCPPDTDSASINTGKE